MSQRQQEDQQLLETMQHYHERSRKTYGIVRLGADFREDGKVVNHKRIARLKRENNLYPKTYKPFVVTTQSEHDSPIAKNVLNRDFEKRAENEAWVSDITYIPVIGRWVYLAVIIDLYSRRVVGWQLATHMKTSLVEQAYESACINRGGDKPQLFHSDRGVQYASEQMQRCLSKDDVLVSMSRKGNCWDNAVSESFFGTLKTELVTFCTFKNIEEARLAIFDYIEVFYNRQRRHSAIGNIAPVEYESLKKAV